MKNILFAGLLFAAIATSSSAVFAQSTDAPISRADVKAQLAAADKNGQLDVVRTESYPQLLPYQAAQAATPTNAGGLALTQANAGRVRAQ